MFRLILEGHAVAAARLPLRLLQFKPKVNQEESKS